MANIAFRRVHGRIIPIKMDKATKDGVLKGGAAVAVGAAISAGGGKVYRKMVSKSVVYASKAWKGLDKVDVLAKKPLRTQSLFASSARQKGIGKILAKGEAYGAAGAKLAKFAAPARIGALVIGSGLIGLGASKLHQAIDQKKKTDVKAGAVGAAVASGAFLTGAYGAAGARTALKSTFVKAYPYIRALKGKLKL